MAGILFKKEDMYESIEKTMQSLVDLEFNLPEYRKDSVIGYSCHKEYRAVLDRIDDLFNALNEFEAAIERA